MELSYTAAITRNAGAGGDRLGSKGYGGRKSIANGGTLELDAAGIHAGRSLGLSHSGGSSHHSHRGICRLHLLDCDGFFGHGGDYRIGSRDKWTSWSTGLLYDASCRINNVSHTYP